MQLVGRNDVLEMSTHFVPAIGAVVQIDHQGRIDDVPELDGP